MQARLWGAVIAGLAVAPAAASMVPAPPAATARPFAEVQDGQMVFEADPENPERGIFRVTTTEPMICAIVWGPTERLGNFNNSLSMNGTGIVQHDVALPGVEPGREYFYVVQGTTSDGTWYRSGLDTFTIDSVPPTSATADIATGDNLALEATVVEVSSEFGTGWEASNAIDDSGLTEWSSDGDGDEAFITIDLGSPRPIDAVEFVTRSMLDGTAVTETYVVTIDDEQFGPFPAGTAAAPAPSHVDAVGEVVRFDVETSTGGNVGAVEVRVLAPFDS